MTPCWLRLCCRIWKQQFYGSGKKKIEKLPVYFCAIRYRNESEHQLQEAEELFQQVRGELEGQIDVLCMVNGVCLCHQVP